MNQKKLKQIKRKSKLKHLILMTEVLFSKKAINQRKNGMKMSARVAVKIISKHLKLTSG